MNSANFAFTEFLEVGTARLGRHSVPPQGLAPEDSSPPGTRLLPLPASPLRLERCLQLFGPLLLSTRGLAHGDVFDFRSLQATLQQIQLLEDLLDLVPQHTHPFRESLRTLRWRVLRRLPFRQDLRSVLWRRGRDLLPGQRDSLARIGRVAAFARFPVGTHGISRNAPGAGHPLHMLRSALAFEFACAKHLAYACWGDFE